MTLKPRSDTLLCTREELGKSGQLWVDFELDYEADPGEPMVMYYRDGSGYPGCPPTAELTRVRVTEFGQSDMLVRTRTGNDEWFHLLDDIVTELMLDDWDDYEQQCLEQCEEAEQR